MKTEFRRFRFANAVALMFLMVGWSMLTCSAKAEAEIGSQQRILASDAEAEDHFGSSVGISNGVVIVGAPWKSGDDEQSGAAYLFDRSGTNTWNFRIKPSRPDSISINNFDHFGTSVAISGRYAIIGAGEVNGPGNNAGAAYILNIDSEITTKIKAADAEAGDMFGGSVAISGNYAIVGARMEGTLGQGAAYIFQRTSVDSWNNGEKIIDPVGSPDDHFGFSVAISGDYAIVGSPHADHGGNYAGAACIFMRRVTDNAWVPNTRKLSQYPQTEGFFGYSVSISGNYAIVGAYGEDEEGTDAGAAYILMREGYFWNNFYKLVAPDAQAGDQFGISVAIDGDYAIVGAPYQDSGGDGAGAAYVFKRIGSNTWDSGTKVMATNAQAGENFGYSVAISGNYAIIGARYNDTSGYNAGAAYVIYDLDAPPPSPDDSSNGDGGCFISKLMN